MRNMGHSGFCKGIAAIVGVGPRLGRSIARKFAHEGYTVAILARDLERLSVFADEIAREEKTQVFAIRIDCSESRSIREAFEGVLSLGFVEVLVYNAYQSPLSSSSNVPVIINFSDVSLDYFQKSMAVSSLGGFLCAQQVLPGMVERRRGTILFTGCSAALNGVAGYSDFCCGKFALRGLSQCLAKEFHLLGVHVAHVIIHGSLAPPRGAISASTAPQPCHGASSSASSVGDHHNSGVEAAAGVSDGWMDPDALAQTYWHLHIQIQNKVVTNVCLTCQNMHT